MTKNRKILYLNGQYLQKIYTFPSQYNIRPRLFCLGFFMLDPNPVLKHLQDVSTFCLSGVVKKLQGVVLSVLINSRLVRIASRCQILPDDHQSEPIIGEVIGFDEAMVLVMTFSPPYGIHPGCQVIFETKVHVLYPDVSWKGRVLNGLGQAIDHKGPMKKGQRALSTKSAPPLSHLRHKVMEPMDVGVRTMNTFLTCCKGQRLGIFAGSGVGKSMLLSMLSRFSACDVCVIGLIGERGREVRDFIEDTLGPQGLSKSVLVVATSDESALMRKEAAYLTMTVAEYFRDLGMSVLCVMDSVTRFAMALREIGLASGEPPATKGYTPSVFSELPKLLERAGPGICQRAHEKMSLHKENASNSYCVDMIVGGSITGFFTVLVDGDDHNEPIADSVRGILDGHIVLDRQIAARGIYPAINILQSISRTVPMCHQPQQRTIVQKARFLFSTYSDMADLIRLGAYQTGSNPDIDEAIYFSKKLEQFFTQHYQEHATISQSFEVLEKLLNHSH
jgi:flagellum-specific ATP synthase